MHPGSCMVCGSGNCDDGYLDLGVFYDYEGTCYLCMTCAYQAGETVGLYTPDEVASQLSLIEELRVQNAELTKELDRVGPFVSAAEQFMRTTGTDLVAVDLGSRKAANEGKQYDQYDSSAVTEHADSGEPESKESVTESGPSDAERSELRDGNSSVVFS